MARFTTRVAVAALDLVTLSGCAGGTDDSPEPPEAPASEADSGAGSPTACLVDKTWSVVVDDLAGQVLSQMQYLGSPATSVTGTGSMTITFAEESLVNT